MNRPENQHQPLDEYVSLLYHWNRRIRLVGEKDPETFRRKHLGEVVAAFGVLASVDWQLAIDIGSGNGLVAVPLALTNPTRHVIAMEPRQKKCAFLRMVRHELGLTNLEVAATRLETFVAPAGARMVWTARALEITPALLVSVLRRHPGDHLLLFSGETSPATRVLTAGREILSVISRQRSAADPQRTVTLARILG